MRTSAHGRRLDTVSGEHVHAFTRITRQGGQGRGIRSAAAGGASSAAARTGTHAGRRLQRMTASMSSSEMPSAEAIRLIITHCAELR
jgi:hypothetical protein